MNKAELKTILALLESSNPDKKDMKRIIAKLKKEIAPIKISSAKGKGRNLQQKVAKSISRYTGIAYGADEMIASREMGQSGTDVRLIGPAKKAFPFAVECKSGESWSLPATIRQAKANEDPLTTWLVVLKRKEWYSPVVCIDFDKFMSIFFRK